MAQNTDSAARQLGVKIQLHHLLAVELEQVTCLSIPICKTGLMPALTSYCDGGNSSLSAPRTGDAQVTVTEALLVFYSGHCGNKEKTPHVTFPS